MHPIYRTFEKAKLNRNLNRGVYHVLYKEIPSLPYSHAEVIGDGVRVLCVPYEGEVHAAEVKLFPPDKRAPAVAGIWPKADKEWEWSLTIPVSAHPQFKALAAAADCLTIKHKRKSAGVAPKMTLEWDTASIIGKLNVSGMHINVDGTPEALGDKAKGASGGKIGFAAQYLLDALNPNGDTRIRLINSANVCLIDDPLYPAAWQLLLMPVSSY